MVNTLSGSVCAYRKETVKPRFIRIDEVSSIEQREGRGIRQGNENEEVAIYRYVTKGTFDAYNWSLVENKQRFISQVMTSKAVSRSCEDIDEATLSYAEIKAVATGNPLIKEKMEIDNDVQRLKLLKASYDNQRYGLQDNFMIKYPKLIKTATEKLANVREDVKARDKELIDNPEFAITIGKATYTERVDGGTMMLEAISKCKTGETTAIGKFHGFELLVEKNFLGINYMVLRGKTEYKAELSTSPVGSMVKLENLFNEQIVEAVLDKINEAQIWIPDGEIYDYYRRKKPQLQKRLDNEKVIKFKSYVSFYKSIVDQDRASVVICNLKHEIIYMNPAAVISYAKRGGDKLIGRSLLDCHNPESRDKIQQVVEWFAANESHNIVYTFHNEKQNKDVYMVALRDEGKLIGYYEKHEYRNVETMKLYDLW